MLRALLFPLLVALISANAAELRADDPESTVEAFHAGVNTVFSNIPKTDTRARFDALSAHMDQAYDFTVMIKTASGKHWRNADDAQRARLLDAFRRMSIAAYVNQYGVVNEGVFVITGNRKGPRRLELVDSLLVTPKREVDLTYVVRRSDAGWRIIDVLLEGSISELGVRASEYASTLKTGGAEALVKSLNTQAERLLNR